MKWIQWPLCAAVLLCAVFAPSAGAAEKEKDSGNAAGQEVNLRLLAFFPEQQLAEVHAREVADDEATPVAMPLKSYLNHEFVKLKTGADRLVFTTKADRDSATKAGELLGEVSLPGNTHSVLLVFFPNKEGEIAKCRIVAFDDSRKAFPEGSFLTANICPLPAKLTLETTDYDFEPDEVKLIAKPPLREGRVSGMRAHVKQDDAWKQFATGLWSDPGSGRSLKVFFQSPDSGKLQVRAFDDVQPREIKEEQEAAAATKGKKKKAKKR